MADSNTGSRGREARTMRWPSLPVVGLIAIALIFGTPPALRTLNRVLDRSPSGAFAGVVADKYALKGQGWYLTLKGAPHLPMPNNTIDVNVGVRDYDAAPLGDSVFVVVKPGFFKSPWIVSYRVQTPQDRVQQLLERHGAIEHRDAKVSKH